MRANDDSRHFGYTALLIASVLLLNACAAPGPSRPPARIEIQEDVGFTITEDAPISGDVRTEYEEALVLLEQGRLEEGIGLLEIVAEAAPLLTAPRIDLAIAQHRAGNLEDAEKNLLQSLELNPQHPVAHNELGIIYRKSGRFADARSSYEAALAVYPGYHYARRNLAILCDLYLVDPDCALENYEAYMATVPSDDEATMWLADLRNRIGNQVAP
jgi:tetratricopeptide (TPR) repeat protein